MNNKRGPTNGPSINETEKYNKKLQNWAVLEKINQIYLKTSFQNTFELFLKINVGFLSCPLLLLFLRSLHIALKITVHFSLSF